VRPGITRRTARAITRDYRSRVREPIACILCGADPSLHRIVLRNDVFSMGLRTVVCNRCAMVMTNPRLRLEDYRRFYESDYQKLYNDVQEPEPGYIGRRGFDAAACFRVRYYARWFWEGMRLLDVGSGSGSFLQALKVKYPQAMVRGLEPVASFAQFAVRTSGAPIDVSTIETMPEDTGNYDIVTVFHVLEHLVDPLGTLRHIRTRLRPGGRLVVEVPNIMGSWKGIGMFHIAHTCAFSQCTLSRMITQAGFIVEHCDDADYPGLESALFVVARSQVSGQEIAPDVKAEPGEIENTARWISLRTRRAALSRLKKTMLLNLRAIRQVLKAVADSPGSVGHGL
jgi:2-polyprenyl-3-methyl-5-hydroxy-6-metoxy-1,4-benzoquinol methylase